MIRPKCCGRAISTAVLIRNNSDFIGLIVGGMNVKPLEGEKSKRQTGTGRGRKKLDVGPKNDMKSN